MTKSELIARLAAKNPHLYQRDVERIVATVFDEISKALASGDRVELRGFGAFSVKKRDPRTGRNPRTGEQVAVASKRVPYFKTGKDLRDRLNKEAARAAGLASAETGRTTARNRSALARPERYGRVERHGARARAASAGRREPPRPASPERERRRMSWRMTPLNAA